jgi:hypothetical protein
VIRANGPQAGADFSRYNIRRRLESMKSQRFTAGLFVMIALSPIAARADAPPIMQALTSFSGPVQAYQCLYEGVANDALRENVKVRNRSSKTLTGVSIRYRWYDASGAKIFDNVATVPANLDSGERGELGPPNGFGEPNGATRRILCSISQAQFSDGSTWVAGQKYHGKLLPAAFSEGTP